VRPPGRDGSTPEPASHSGVCMPMRPLLFAAALVLTPHVAVSQVTIVDEGSFTVTRDGRTGREDFRIVRTAGAAAQARAMAMEAARVAVRMALSTPVGEAGFIRRPARAG